MVSTVFLVKFTFDLFIKLLLNLILLSDKLCVDGRLIVLFQLSKVICYEVLRVRLLGGGFGLSGSWLGLLLLLFIDLLSLLFSKLGSSPLGLFFGLTLGLSLCESLLALLLGLASFLGSGLFSLQLCLFCG